MLAPLLQAAEAIAPHHSRLRHLNGLFQQFDQLLLGTKKLQP
jgi:hypothetical protein